MGEVIRDLVDLGILEMVPDPDDGRAKIVRYTAEGRAFASDGLPAPARPRGTVRGRSSAPTTRRPDGCSSGWSGCSARPGARTWSGVADPRRLLAELPQPALRVLVAGEPVDVDHLRARRPSRRARPGPTYVAPGRSAVAAISIGQAPCAADCETALMVASRIEAMPPAERPYWPLAARWVPAKPGCAASALTGSAWLAGPPVELVGEEQVGQLGLAVDVPLAVAAVGALVGSPSGARPRDRGAWWRRP